MPEAVIIDAIRTPIGRAMKGTLRDVRADDLAAVPLRALVERNPGVKFGETNDVLMGCGFPGGGAGLQHRPQRGVAGGDRSSRPGGHGQPVLRVVVADDPDGVSRDQGRRGRSVHRGRRGVRLARRGPDVPVDEPAHRRHQRHRLQRLHLDGDHRRERRRALPRLPRVPGRVGGDSPSSARWRRARAGTSTARSSASRSPSCMTPAATSSPRTPSPATTARGPAPRWRSSRRSSPSSSPTARSPRATRARSTTAPPRSW